MKTITHENIKLYNRRDKFYSGGNSFYSGDYRFYSARNKLNLNNYRAVAKAILLDGTQWAGVGDKGGPIHP